MASDEKHKVTQQQKTDATNFLKKCRAKKQFCKVTGGARKRRKPKGQKRGKVPKGQKQQLKKRNKNPRKKRKLDIDELLDVPPLPLKKRNKNPHKTKKRERSEDLDLEELLAIPLPPLPGRKKHKPNPMSKIDVPPLEFFN